MILLFTGLAVWRVVNLRHSIENGFRSRAEVVARQTSDAVTSAINTRFYDLQFLKNTFFDPRTGKLIPRTEALSAFTLFQTTHPGITAINILDPSGNRIIWSSMKQSTKPITSGQEFTPLLSYPNSLIGTARYAKRANAWVLTMRQRIEDNEGHVLGFIGSPFILSNFGNIHTPPDVQSILLTMGQLHVISIWQNGNWAPPNTHLPNPAGQVAIQVPGYPWVLQVQWTAEAMKDNFWQVERPRLGILLIILLLLAGMGLFTFKVLRQLLRLRQYQAAAVAVQQNLLRQNGPQAIYQRLVDVLVEQSEAIGAYVVVFDEDSECLRVAAAAADDPGLSDALKQLLLSETSAANSPDRDLVSTRAFNEKTAQRYRNQKCFAWLKFVSKTAIPLTRIQSAMAFPIFMSEASEPFAVLVVASDSSSHFTQPLQALLEQLSISVGLVLTQWRQNCQLMKAEQMAFHDVLTDLPNRRLLDSYLGHAMARAIRHRKLLAFCLLDLDNFKPVNDAYGHEAGDEVLKAIGQRLPKALRLSDFVARLGGDEFVLLVEELSSEEDLGFVLAKVEAAITTPIYLNKGEIVQVSASMGVTCFPSGQENGEQLFRQADQALYKSKNNKDGRDRFWTIFRN